MGTKGKDFYWRRGVSPEDTDGRPRPPILEFPGGILVKNAVPLLNETL
jgi:hypothetical protein